MKKVCLFVLLIFLFTGYVSAEDDATEVNLTEHNLTIEIKEFDDAFLMICEDSNCNKPESTFVLNQDKIFAKLIDPYAANVSAVLINPREQKESVDFHDGLAYVMAPVSGNYELKVSLSKEGVAPRIMKTKFSVLEKLPVIRKEQLCNDDGVCNEGETYQNCPQDCAEKKGGLWLYILLIMFVIAAIVIIVFIFMHRKKIEPEQPPQMPAAQGYYPQQRQFDNGQYRRFR